MESNTKRDSSIVNKKKKKKGDPTWGLNPKVEQHCTIVSLFYGIILSYAYIKHNIILLSNTELFHSY